MPTGWTIRGGDFFTKLYAIVLENGNMLAGVLTDSSTIEMPTLQTEASFTSGTLIPTAYDDGVIALAGKKELIPVGTGWGQDAAHAGSLMFYAATAGPVLGINLTAGGHGYTVAPTVVFSGSNPTPAAATAVLGALGEVVSVTVTNGGTGYPQDGPVTFSGGGGSGAAGTLNVDELGAITSVTMVAAGANYTTPPTPNAAGGVGAVLAAVLGFPVTSITLDDPGDGYTTLPTITFTGGGSFGEEAAASVIAIGTALPAGTYGVVLRLAMGTVDDLNDGSPFQNFPASWTIPLTVTTAPV